MQEYKNKAINYAEHYVNMLKQWWWPSQPVPQTPFEQLAFYLLHSNIQFQTKHTDKKIVFERLGMMYNELINGCNKKYESFKPSIQIPVQYMQQQNQKEKQVQKQDKKKSVLSIVGEIKIQTQKIKCNLFLSIVLHEKIQTQLPYIYIRNPDARRFQSNPQFVTTNEIYKPIMGGITLSDKQLWTLGEEWKRYKSTNLLDLVKKIDGKLHENFPFVKRYQTYDEITTQSEQFKTVKNLKMILDEHLEKIQKLIITKTSIQSETRYLKDQNSKLNETLAKENRLKEDDFGKTIDNMFKIQENQELLDLVCRQRALLDCIKMVEAQEDNSPIQIIGYENVAHIVRNISMELFQIRFKIFLMMQNKYIN